MTSTRKSAVRLRSLGLQLIVSLPVEGSVILALLSAITLVLSLLLLFHYRQTTHCYLNPYSESMRSKRTYVHFLRKLVAMDMNPCDRRRGLEDRLESSHLLHF